MQTKEAPEGELIYSRADFTWLPRDEYERRRAEREERAFMRRASQGQVCAPMVISDSLGSNGIQSMVDGRIYDSKASLRRHYRQSGVVEVGNDVPKTKFVHSDKPQRDPSRDRKQTEALAKAFKRVGLPTC